MPIIIKNIAANHWIYYDVRSLYISISYYAFIVILLTYEFLLHGKDDDEEVEQSD